MKRTIIYNHHDDHHHNHHHEHDGYHRGHGDGHGRHHDHNHDHNHQHGGRHSGGGFGPSGSCICIKCETKVPHQRGVKCTELKCPECGHVMARQELLEKRKQSKKTK